MTVEEIYQEYIKLVPEERADFMTKVIQWLKKAVEEREKNELDKNREEK